MVVYIANVIDGKVVGVAVVDDGSSVDDDWYVVGNKNVVGIGWTYDGSVFIPPPEIKESPE